MNTERSVRPVLDSELATWRQAIGNSRVQHAVADAEVLRRFALASGTDPDVERRPPALAHWALFVDAVATGRLGSDGHPRRGGFIPAVHLPRRMFASSAMEFPAALRVGEPAQCVSTIAAVDHKRGRSGDLVFVNVVREVSQGGRLCVREQQTIVYRGNGDRLEPVRETAFELPEHETWSPGTVELFRFSAVTFNAHRIHYDQRYAHDVEGYPDLVVHGPFTAVKLLDYASRSAGRTPRAFSFRTTAPLFVAQPVRLSAGDGEGVFVATRCDGITAMTARVEFA